MKSEFHNFIDQHKQCQQLITNFQKQIKINAKKHQKDLFKITDIFEDEKQNFLKFSANSTQKIILLKDLNIHILGNQKQKANKQFTKYMGKKNLSQKSNLNSFYSTKKNSINRYFLKQRALNKNTNIRNLFNCEQNYLLLYKKLNEKSIQSKIDLKKNHNKSFQSKHSIKKKVIAKNFILTQRTQTTKHKQKVTNKRTRYKSLESDQISQRLDKIKQIASKQFRKHSLLCNDDQKKSLKKVMISKLKKQDKQDSFFLKKCKKFNKQPKQNQQKQPILKKQICSIYQNLKIQDKNEMQFQCIYDLNKNQQKIELTMVDHFRQNQFLLYQNKNYIEKSEEQDKNIKINQYIKQEYQNSFQIYFLNKEKLNQFINKNFHLYLVPFSLRKIQRFQFSIQCLKTQYIYQAKLFPLKNKVNRIKRNKEKHSKSLISFLKEYQQLFEQLVIQKEQKLNFSAQNNEFFITIHDNYEDQNILANCLNFLKKGENLQFIKNILYQILKIMIYIQNQSNFYLSKISLSDFILSESGEVKICNYQNIRNQQNNYAYTFNQNQISLPPECFLQDNLVDNVLMHNFAEIAFSMLMGKKVKIKQILHKNLKGFYSNFNDFQFFQKLLQFLESYKTKVIPLEILLQHEFFESVEKQNFIKEDLNLKVELYLENKIDYQIQEKYNSEYLLETLYEKPQLIKMDFRLTELNIEIKPLNYLNENQQKTQAKILRISTQLLSTSLGIGIFGVPVAANLAGTWMFILVVFGIAILQYQSNHALLLCQKKLNTDCLQTLIKKTFGLKVSTIIIYTLMMISLMCSIICYTLIIAQSLMTSFHYMAQNWQIKVPEIMRSQDNCFWIIITNLLLTPLLYFKRYSSYSLISLISCLLMSIIVISIVCTAIFDSEETNCQQYQIIKEGQLISLPIIFFAFASHHSIMDFITESYQNTKKHIVNGLKIHTIVLAILYLVMGLVGVCRFNFQTVQFNYGNILGSYNMNPLLCIICNFCLVGFIGLNNLINFKPGKQILTILFRRNNRDSFLWSFTCITIMQLVQIAISCYIFMKGFQIHYLFAVIGIIEPITSNLVSFIIFHKIYYYDKSQDLRRYFYYMFMFLVVFCMIASLLSIIFYAVTYLNILKQLNFNHYNIINQI